MFDDVDDAVARLHESVRRAPQRAAQVPPLQQAMHGVRSRAAPSSRDIAVEVDHTGQVTSLRIADSALGRGGARLAAELVGALNAARHDARKHAVPGERSEQPAELVEAAPRRRPRRRSGRSTPHAGDSGCA
jgi:hypothetical protein